MHKATWAKPVIITFLVRKEREREPLNIKYGISDPSRQ